MKRISTKDKDRAGSWLINISSVKEQTVNRIREAILNGELSIGEQLVETDLAERVGVSRVPIREALQQLTSEGLVDYVPRIGRFVHTPTLEEIHDIQEIRGTLEGLAARTLAERIKENGEKRWLDGLNSLIEKSRRCLENGDLPGYFENSRAFHEEIVLSTKNDILVKLYEFIMNRAELIPLLIGRMPGRQHEAIDEHEKILEAIMHGDRQQADSLTQDHYMRGMFAIQKGLEEIKKQEENMPEIRYKKILK